MSSRTCKLKQFTVCLHPEFVICQTYQTVSLYSTIVYASKKTSRVYNIEIRSSLIIDSVCAALSNSLFDLLNALMANKHLISHWVLFVLPKVSLALHMLPYTLKTNHHYNAYIFSFFK